MIADVLNIRSCVLEIKFERKIKKMPSLSRWLPFQRFWVFSHIFQVSRCLKLKSTHPTRPADLLWFLKRRHGWPWILEGKSQREMILWIGQFDLSQGGLWQLEKAKGVVLCQQKVQTFTLSAGAKSFTCAFWVRNPFFQLTERMFGKALASTNKS